MGILDKMNAAKAASAPKQAAGNGSPRRSKYGGITAAQPRDPMPTVGQYVFRIDDITEGYNQGKGHESFKITLSVIESSGEEAVSAGSTVSAIFLISGKGGPAGLQRVKAFAMAAAGFDSEEEYDAFDPDGLFIEACVGGANEFADQRPIGKLVACEVTRGNPLPGGTDYYREYHWYPLDQDAAS